MKNKINYILILLILTLTSCTTTQINTKNLQNNISNQYNSQKNKQLDEQLKENNITLNKQSEKLEEIISQIENVKDCAIIITGNTAIVGLLLHQELKDTKIIELKTKITKIILENDSSIIHVAVTVSEDLFDKIIEIENDDGTIKNKDRNLFFKVTPII